MNTTPTALDLLEQENKHFHSGINAPGEVRGMAGRIGVSVAEPLASGRVGLLEALAERAELTRTALFVDSGAFSEMNFPKNAAPTLKKLITHAEWVQRLSIYAELASYFRTRCYIVAPDMVANQAETLARLVRYGRIIREIAYTHRCQVIVPVQKGAASMAEFFATELRILNLGADCAGDAIYPIAGIPMKKDATTIEELEEFARHMPADGRFHLLGLGPKNDRWPLAIAAILRQCPEADITSDSGTLQSLIGTTNGRAGGPRAYTEHQHLEKARSGKTGNPLKEVAAAAVSYEIHMRDLARRYEAGWSDPELEGFRPGFDT